MSSGKAMNLEVVLCEASAGSFPPRILVRLYCSTPGGKSILVKSDMDPVTVTHIVAQLGKAYKEMLEDLERERSIARSVWGPVEGSK